MIAPLQHHRQSSIGLAARLRDHAFDHFLFYRSFPLSLATTQWGSCTADGKIRLNWRLIHFALPLIDYVVAHELSHLRDQAKAAGAVVTREPGPVKGGATMIAFVQDPDGYKIELIERQAD